MTDVYVLGGVILSIYATAKTWRVVLGLVTV